MNENPSTHPTEEALYSCITGVGDEETHRHLEHCVECRDIVDSIRAISSNIAAIEEEAVPEGLNEAVMAITGRSPRNGRQAALPFWSLNPLSMGLLAAMLFIAFSIVLVLLL